MKPPQCVEVISESNNNFCFYMLVFSQDYYNLTRMFLKKIEHLTFQIRVVQNGKQNSSLFKNR